MNRSVFGEILKDLALWQIKYEVEDWRVRLSGGDDKARYHYDGILREDKDLQAMLILYAANKDSNLHELIEERAAIRWADGLPGDLLSAVKCNLGDEEE